MSASRTKDRIGSVVCVTAAMMVLTTTTGQWVDDAVHADAMDLLR